MRRTKAMLVPCPDDDTFGALVAGTLSNVEREAIAVHAATCESCHGVLAGLTAVSGDDEGETLVLRAGTQIGRFTIAERLGIGGMGVVYAATDDELERRVALKLLRPERAGRDARARLVREARTLARLSHPNIVTVFDVGEHRGNVYVVMELVEGGSITAWCARQPRTADEIVNAMIDAGRGIAAAHAAGFVHRDIKPDNILVGHDGRVRVTDFGLARIGETVAPAEGELTNTATQLTKTGTLLGTPAYMAPETALGETSERADQWAFCASLYELLAGVRPFPLESPARGAAITDGKLQAPERKLPAAAVPVIARGLRADPAARWPDMMAVVNALRPRRRTVPIAVGAVVAIGIGTTVALAWPASVEPELAPPLIVDRREGCSCPYSACANRCVGVCTARAYTIGEPIPGINVTGRQEANIGISTDGKTIAYLSGRSCSLERLYVARQAGAFYFPVDLTDQISVPIHEGCCSMSSDAASLLLVTADRKFVESRLDGGRLGPAAPLFDPRAISPTLLVRWPVLSADRRTLYYQIIDHDERNEPGPLDGVYVAERDSPDGSFREAHRITGAARRFERVSGESSDGLSLFMIQEFGTRVVMRTSKRDSYGDPAAWTAPPWLHGNRGMPTGDCRRVLITSSPGGCEQEDLRFIYATED